MPSEKNQPSPTIVGGQPSGKRDTGKKISRGIERIVLLAAAKRSFRKRFGQNRESALRHEGIELTAEERLVLESISDQEIFVMAGCMVPESKAAKRKFLRAAATLAALSGLHACSSESTPVDGIRPDPPTRGIQPDLVEQVETRTSFENQSKPHTGIRPYTVVAPPDVHGDKQQTDRE
jgi:hypothetical protein